MKTQVSPRKKSYHRSAAFIPATPIELAKAVDHFCFSFQISEIGLIPISLNTACEISDSEHFTSRLERVIAKWINQKKYRALKEIADLILRRGRRLKQLILYRDNRALNSREICALRIIHLMEFVELFLEVRKEFLPLP